MNSQIGANPANAAPTAKPANPDSVMGVSITYNPLEHSCISLKAWEAREGHRTLFSPNLSSNPLVTLYAPLYLSQTSAPRHFTTQVDQK